jgi:hypothetical protein
MTRAELYALFWLVLEFVCQNSLAVFCGGARFVLGFKV